MVKIKSMDQIKKNYSDSTGVVPGRYKAGVQANTDWHEKASSDSAEELFAAKMQAAIQAKRRQRGLQGTNQEQWKKQAGTRGAANIGSGMKANVDKQAANFRPYRDVIEATNLPDKVADPMANVDNRLKPIVQGLVDKKKEIKG